MKKLIILFSFFFISIAGIGHAACTDPVADEGAMVYNTNYKVMQFCNGTDWISMASSFSAGGEAPSGAVMAFDLAACPTGWAEYTAARGRFPRGIDPTGTNDPDGVRTAGSVQESEIQEHAHYILSDDIISGGSTPNSNNYVARTRNSVGDYNYGLVASNNSPSIASSSNSGGDETRPKNFAVLYCRKD